MKKDPTRSLDERTPDEIGEYLDDHLLMAMEAAHRLTDAHDTAEDLVRDRLVALSDTYVTGPAIAKANSDRRTDRFRALLQVDQS